MAGGYQAPASPAPVSGPGSLSRRTDGGPGQPLRTLGDAQYGEEALYQEQQRAAPLAQDPSIPSPSPSDIAGAGEDVIPFGAPTQRPDEPVTAGADAGLGPGSEVLGSYREPRGTITFVLRGLQAHDLTGAIADLYREAERRGL